MSAIAMKAIGKAAKGLLSQVGPQAAGGLMGMATAKWNDKRQISQQRKLQELQIQGGKEMADYAQEKQMEMWQDTGYGAQKEQMKSAGLNPALIYGQSGGGGQSTGSGGAMPSAGSATGGGGEIMGLIRAGQEAKLLNAQKENIEADTANKRADAANKPLTGKNIEADTVNKTLQSLIIEYGGKEAKSMYEEVNQPNRQIQARAKTDEYSGISAEGQVKNALFIEGKLLEGELNKIKGLDLTNQKTVEEIKAITKRVANETKLADNKLTDDAYYRTIHDVADSFGLTINSAKDVLNVILRIVGAKMGAKK